MKDKVTYSYDSENNFIVENYHWAAPFSGFFPGIAGKFGIPLWTYYVSRGQAVCSLGSRDKDGAILEFLSFNRACQMVGNQGFRTFLRMNDGSIYEPFRKIHDEAIHQKLKIQSHEISLEEWNETTGLKVAVTYIPLVHAPIGGLIRQLTITNCTDLDVDLQVLDGVSRLIPYGVSFENVKVISRHIEGMMGVKDSAGIPLFRLKQTAQDHSQIGQMEAANFYVSMVEDGGLVRGRYLVDPEVIFSSPFDLSFPWAFKQDSVEDLLGNPQVMENRTPCAFTPMRCTLQGGTEASLHTILGYTSNETRLMEYLKKNVGASFLDDKRQENKALIEGIQNYAFTASSQPIFDRYCQETFLENVMRGGMPTFFNSGQESSPCYIYARQNGDLERDYHWFVLEPTYLSQGNGHYRSICQNRRMDSWFFPQITSHNIKLFMNLIQLDGYNPLVVNGQRYVAEELPSIEQYLKSRLSKKGNFDGLMEFLAHPFTPGELLLHLEDMHDAREFSYDTFLAGLLPLCREMEVGDIHTGFWVDHWLYNLDLIEQYLKIFPERLEELLWEDSTYSFYDNPDVVRPRREKYVEHNGDIRQYQAVIRDVEKEELIVLREVERHKVRDRHGQGRVYRTNLFVKLLCLIANKLAVLDPAGIGIEMEADKPGWNDSLNGLPGLMGSSLCQTLELLRAFRFLNNSIFHSGLKDAKGIAVYEELVGFVRGLTDLMDVPAEDVTSFELWERRHQLLESYRNETRLGISGVEVQMDSQEIHRFIRGGLEYLENLFSDSTTSNFLNERGIPHTYFINQFAITGNKELGESSVSESNSEPFGPPNFQLRTLPAFLEGPVHYLRLFPKRSQEVIDAVRSSDLFDVDLQMYKVCESLQAETHEIGRIWAYPRGWIENESIYTHMEYKWLLEILRSGEPEVFYKELKNLLPPFMPPQRYGRSVVENCSFIVSSAYPDPDIHGRAFQPRLSGVTAEWLEIWSLMVGGSDPFRLDPDGNITLVLEPMLPDWLFTEQERVVPFWEAGSGWKNTRIPADCFAFRFLGQTLLIYHNPDRKSTYGSSPASITKCTFIHSDGIVSTETDHPFSSRYARDVRRGNIRRMDVFLN